MSQDNVLRKEFTKKDVQRARNLIQGKSGDRTTEGIGYSKKYTFHKEGDIWEKNGRKWTIKDGIKQNITKFDDIKKVIKTPLFCPNCKKQMKHKFDPSYYKIHKKCHDCIIEFEHQLRMEGKYDDYIKELKAKNSLNMVNDMESYLLNAVNATNNGYVSEQGTIERWVGGIDKEKMTKDIIEGAQIRRESIKKELSGKKTKRTN